VQNHGHLWRPGVWGPHWMSTAEFPGGSWLSVLGKAHWDLTWCHGLSAAGEPVAMMLCPEAPPQSTVCALP
jgi:hypothetical protein